MLGKLLAYHTVGERSNACLFSQSRTRLERLCMLCLNVNVSVSDWKLLFLCEPFQGAFGLGNT
jgi:hypothetical protein